MLTLAKASSYFDRTPVLDVVSGKLLFLGQVDPYNDAQRDSGTAYRRILSVAAGTKLPASRLVKILGRTWIVGDSEVDGMAEIHREKFVLHPASYSVTVSRLSSYVAGTFTFQTWGDLVWYKDGREDTTSSRAVPMYTLYAPSVSDVREYDIVTVGDTSYLATSPHKLPSGALAATCPQLEYAPASATVNTRVYDPVAGKYTASAPLTVPCLRVRWQSLFLFESQASARYQEGDCSLVFPAGTTLATKDTVALAGVIWNVLEVDSIGGAVVAHGRRG